MKYRYLFGPVLSRRLGMSLGVDLMPHKTCSMDCVYCECGRTTNLTTERKEYIPTELIIKELSDFLGKKPELDYVTFSGSGEPTLHSGIGKIIRYLKRNFSNYKIALITNGSMFHNAAVRREVKIADVVLPSLDVVSDRNFEKVNRPERGLENKKIINGLVNLRKIFDGKIWLEIFVIPGINDSLSELKLLKNTVRKIMPDKIQINTLDRPGTEKWVVPEKYSKLNMIKKYFGRNSEIIVAPSRRKRKSGYLKKTENEILNTIKRRPCTFDDLLNSADLSEQKLNKYLDELIKSKRIVSERLSRGEFFRVEKT